MPNATITAIIPTYRRPKLLKRAIMSVLGQTYPHLKVCVYDNASGDDTRNIVMAIAEKDSRVNYHCHSTNVGLVKNFIYGIQKVDTPFFSVLSDDDVIMPHFYEKAMAGFQSFPLAMFSSMDSIRISTDNKILAGPVWQDKMKFFESGTAFEGIVKGSIPAPWVGTLFRKEIIDEIGLPNPLSGPCLNDNFILRAAARFPCVVCPGIGCAIMENLQSVGYAMDALDATWPKWWVTTVEDIQSDIKVALAIRQQARLIFPDLRRLAFQQVIQGLGNFANKNIEYAKKAASGVGACGYPFTSKCLKLLVSSYTHLFFVRWGLDAAIKLRKARTGKIRFQLNQSFQHHIKFLDQLTNNK